MTPKWQKLASVTQEICTLWFQFFGAVFASKGYPFKNILFSKRFINKFSMRILLKFPNIYRPNTLAAKFSMDLYDLKNLGQRSSNEI